jgi:hypothetical protein
MNADCPPQWALRIIPEKAGVALTPMPDISLCLLSTCRCTALSMSGKSSVTLVFSDSIKPACSCDRGLTA